MSCYDCERADLLRRAAARPGKGLPAIEPGMPVPAGTGLTRREFVSRAAGLALAVYGGSALSGRALDSGIARAASDAAAAQKVLVTVFLNGGVDGLSVLFPAGDPLYYSLRPNLALPQGAGRPFAEDDRLRWHPAASGLATLHDEGKVSVLPAVGYDRANQSHFTSRHYYEVGATDPHLRTGWLGRYLDRVGTPDNPLQGLTLDVALHPSLATAKVPVATLAAADQYTFAPPGLPAHPLESSILQEAANIGAAHARSSDPGLAAAGAVAYDSHHLYYGLGTVRSGFASPVPYPSSADPFPHRLAGLAAMIAAGLPVHVVGLTVGHFDTHATQAASLQRDLQLASDSLLAFQRDLEARGLADRVLVHVWSEFGRRGAENASRGTDHGAAGLGLLIGSRVSGKQVGSFPGLTGGLDPSGNLRPTADFRAVQAALLEQWLGTDADAILPGASVFQRPALLR
ncbi:MAG TPA: DUF1501 domain-containing protein [Gaiellaceae bacterium]|nr:DUF1501 domain-containing protein [Gaiellaceae bacterium]